MGYYLVSDEALGPNILALALTVASMCCYLLGKYFRGHFFSMFAYSGAIVFVVLIFFVASRTVMLAIGLILLLFSVVDSLRQGRSVATLVGRALLTLTLAMAAFAAILVSIPDAYSERFFALFNVGADYSFVVRLGLWSQALDLFYEAPFFGVGYGHFQQEVGRTAHNEILGHMTGGGLVGAFLACGVYIMVGYRSIRYLCRGGGSNQDVVFIKLSLALVITALVVGVTENFSESYNSTLLPFLWFFFGLASRRIFASNFRNNFVNGVSASTK